MTWQGHDKEQLAVGIVGLGYVGLPLALQFVRGGCRVTGFDIDQAKVAALKNSQSYIRHISSADIAKARQNDRFVATTDFSQIAHQDAILICVPTPLNAHREPDLSFVLSTGVAIAPHLRRGQLVSLESTTYPGTTDEDLRPVLESGSNLKAGSDFLLVFSPEREDPGNAHFSTRDIPKIVGGLTPACRDAGCELYRRAVKQVIPVSCTRTAEATKLMENIFRCINIAMVNELKIVFDRMGVDIWEVIEAAKTKPFGYMPFYPGPGLGGHCIPIDPFYLTWKAREYAVTTKFIELAGEINAGMPLYVVHRLMEALSDRGRPLKGAKVLMLGLAYKKNVDDPRESPSFELWELLRNRGAVVSFHDPFISKAPRMRHYPDVEGTPSVVLSPETLRACDAVLIATDHDNIDYEAVVTHARLVVDTRNACARVPDALKTGKVVKA